MTPPTILRYAYLCVNASTGQRPQQVAVLAVHPTRIEILALRPTVLGGRGRQLQKGETALVPTWAVKNSPSKPPPENQLRRAPKPLRFWRVKIETTTSTIEKKYRAPSGSKCSYQAEKVAGVIRVLSTTEISESEYNSTV